MFRYTHGLKIVYLIFIHLKSLVELPSRVQQGRAKREILSVLGCVSVNTEIRFLEQEEPDR